MSRTDHLRLPTWTEPPDKHRTRLRHRIASCLLGLPTDEEAAVIRAADRAATVYVPGVPPDDPQRLAWEAELRAMGVTPARDWGYWEFKPIRLPDWRDHLRNWIDGGPLDCDEPISWPPFPWDEERESRDTRHAPDEDEQPLAPGYPDRVAWEEECRCPAPQPLSRLSPILETGPREFLTAEADGALRDGWNFVPVGHPDRPEWEKRMRAIGITPAISDVWPDLGPIEFGFTSLVRYRWTRLIDALRRRERP